MTPSTDHSAPDTSSASTYRLPRDQTESIRLNTQHYALTQRQGWLLHPKIQEAVSALNTPQILDAACGTGIWGLEVAEKFPKTFVTGLDISSNQFPPRWTWPSNSTLNTFDLLEEVPSEYRGKFDVLHCRLLLAAGPTVDSKVFVDAFARLLKPGGWLQWEEISYPSMKIVEPILCDGQPTGEYNITPCRCDIWAEAIKMPYKTGWFDHFKTWMEENSTFTNIEQVNLSVHPRTLKIENDVTVTALFSGINRFLQSSELDDAVREGIKKEAAEILTFEAEGKLVTLNFIVGLAKTPESPWK